MHTWFRIEPFLHLNVKYSSNDVNVHIYIRYSSFVHFASSKSHSPIAVQLFFSSFSHSMPVNYFAFFLRVHILPSDGQYTTWKKTVTHTLLVLQNSIFAVRAFESFQDGNPFVMVRDSPFGWWWPYNTHRTTHLLFSGIRNIVSELVSVFHLVCYSHWEYINVFFNSFSFP